MWVETREDTGISLGQSRTWKQVRRILPRFALRGALSRVHVEVRGSRLDEHLAHSTRTRMGVHCPWEEAAARGRVHPWELHFHLKSNRLGYKVSRIPPLSPPTSGPGETPPHSPGGGRCPENYSSGPAAPRGSRVLGEGPGFPVREPIETLGVLHSLPSKYRTSHP